MVSQLVFNGKVPDPYEKEGINDITPWIAMKPDMALKQLALISQDSWTHRRFMKCHEPIGRSVCLCVSVPLCCLSCLVYLRCHPRSRHTLGAIFINMV